MVPVPGSRGGTPDAAYQGLPREPDFAADAAVVADAAPHRHAGPYTPFGQGPAEQAAAIRRGGLLRAKHAHSTGRTDRISGLCPHRHGPRGNSTSVPTAFRGRVSAAASCGSRNRRWSRRSNRRSNSSNRRSNRRSSRQQQSKKQQPTSINCRMQLAIAGQHVQGQCQQQQRLQSDAAAAVRLQSDQATLMERQRQQLGAAGTRKCSAGELRSAQQVAQQAQQAQDSAQQAQIRQGQELLATQRELTAETAMARDVAGESVVQRRVGRRSRAGCL